jgi:hypothetical protein
MAQRAGRTFFNRLWKQQLWNGNYTKSSSSTGALANEGFQRFFSPSFRSSPCSNLGLRQNYYTDARGVVHFKRRGPSVWLQETVRPGGGRPGQQKKLLIILGVAGCGSAYVYFTNLQTVPYTHRQHFVLIGPALERQLGEQEFNSVRILHTLHSHRFALHLVTWRLSFV